MSKIRILIADDHAMVRDGLRLLINAQPDLEVAGEAADGEEALARSREIRPDVVLTDLSMPGPRSTRLIADLVQQCPPSRVLVVTMHDDPAYMRAAIAAGAMGFVVKKGAGPELISAIRTIHRGRMYLYLSRDGTASRPPTIGPEAAGSPAPRLSRREGQVLHLLAQGNTNRQVAEKIHVSVKTVETYRARLGDKLGLHGRSELFRFAVETGLLAPDATEPGDSDH